MNWLIFSSILIICLTVDNMWANYAKTKCDCEEDSE